MAEKQFKAIAKLFLDTKDADSDAKQFCDDLKKRLKDIESAADKMTVFKDLVAYIAQIDKNLAALKAKNADVFSHMFDGLDENLRKQLEGLFGTSKSQLSQIDVLREKLATLTPKSGINELRNFAIEINKLFADMGEIEPFNIEKDFFGRANKEHIQKLTNAVNNFAIVWSNVNSKVSQGFGFGGVDGKLGGTAGGFSEKVRLEIDKLENQARRYQSIIDIFDQVSKMKISWENGDKIELDLEATEQVAKELIDKFNQLNDAINEGNLDEIAYADALANRAKVILQLIEINERLTKTNKNGDIIKESPKFLRNFLATNDDGESLSQYALEDFEYEAPEIILKLKNDIAEVTQQMIELRNSITKSDSISNEMSNIGNAADNSKKKVDALLKSIQNVFMSATDLELRVGRGEAESKETMTLIGLDGSMSNAVGTDKHVDTNTIVSQLIANLKDNIIMSLHNHANGNDMFSPQDLESFANLYFNQGTKINGIIVDGMVKTIDFSGISQELAIKIAKLYSDGIKNIVSKNSNLLTYNDGQIDYTDFVKQLEISDHNLYQEIVSSVQNEINNALNNAFIQNGVEPTVKQFEYAQLPELVKQLLEVQQNAKNALTPIEKLKNLITSLYPDRTFDWSQFTDIFDKFKSGAIDGTQALNQILGFKTITTDAETAASSIDKVSTKVQEFLTLVDEIHNKSFINAGDATDNVEIGKYIERLNSAKVALDLLGDQGMLTADQLEQVNDAFDMATRDLDSQTRTYYGYGDGRYNYSYYDEYTEQRDRADQLQRENENLQDQLNENQQAIDQSIATNAGSELNQLELLRAKLVAAKEAIDAKTRAFEEEYVTVDAVVDAEVQSLQLLSNKLQDILNQINLISGSFTKVNSEIAELNSIKDINVKENITSETTAEKVKETISQNYALDTTLVETNGVLNQILAAIGNNESFSQLVEPLNNAVTELKNVANGIIEHQKAQRTDLTDSSARISNNYGQLSSIAGNAVAGLGDNIQIDQMKSLADNIVRVRGAVQDVSGIWKGFIVDIDESNKAIVRAVDEQSAFTKSLNESAQAAKNVGDEVKKQKSPNNDKFTKSLNEQISIFDKYRKNLKDVSYISDDVRDKLDELGTSLHQVTDTAGLDDWKNKFADIQKQITLAKDTFTAQQVGKVNQAQKTLEASFKTLDFKTTDSDLTVEQQQLVDGYMQVKAVLEAYKKSAQQGNQIELAAIQNVTAALYKQVEVYKQIHNIVNAGGGSKNAYGATAVLNAKAKYNSLSQQATSGEFSNSKVVQQMLTNYTAAYQRLVDIQSKFKTGENLTDEQITGFKQAQTECNNYAKELNKVIVASQKLASEGIDIELLGGDFEDTELGRQSALKDFIETTYGASAKIGEFKDNFNKLTFAVDNGDGTFTQMTATINSARNAIVATAGDTQKATTAFGRFFNELKGKFKTISTYLISSFSLQEIWQQIRQGVNYVREIDSALTELKKVTDETDATYEKFLQTASRTAGVIGSTVADFTNATADFARLGYNIEEASKLAEAASVYKNVGDGIDDVATASESIISTMKAFGIEAENAMGIVDRFNEVGNNFAISSTGIGEALQRSASALYEAGNTIDESIALITGANSVVQNPEQVGTALKTLALRLRGTKTELEEAGEDTDGMAESVSQLQAKLKALTHGKVDIMVDTDTFKNTTEILREMSDAWSEMTDLERASALELMGGKRQANILSSIITNFQTVEDVITTSSNASGSALAENEKYLDSIQGRIDLFTNSLQTMWMNFIDSDVLKFIVDLGTAALKLVDNLGLLPTVIGGFAAFKSAAKEIKTEFEEINKAIRDTKIAKDGENPVVESIQEEIQARENNSNAIKEEKIQTDELTTSKTLGTAAGWKDVIATNAQIVKTKALAVAKGLLKGVLKGVVAMLAAKVIGAAFSAIYKGIDNVIHRAEKIKEEVTDLKKTYEDAKKTFDDNLTTLTTSSDTSVYATLQDEFNALTKGVDKYGNNISLTSDQYERYKSICEKIVGIQPSIAAGYDSVTKAIGQNASVLSELIELQKIQARQNVEQLISDENFGKIVEDAKNDYKNINTQSGTSTNEAYSNAWNVLSPIVSEKLPKYYTSSGRRMTTDANFNGTSEDEIASYILEQIGYTAEEAQKIAAKYYNQYNKYFNIGQFMTDYSDVIKANTEKFGEDYKLTLDNTFYDIEQAIVSAGEDVKEAQDGLVDDFLLVPQGEKAGKYYDQLNDASKKFITDWIKNGSQFKIDQNQTKEAAIANRDKIIEMVKEIASEDFKLDFEGQQITGQDFLDKLYDLDATNINWGEYKVKAQAMLDEFWNQIGGDENEFGATKADLKLAFGLEFINDESREDRTMYETRSQISEIIDKSETEIQDWLDTLPPAKVKKFYEIDWNKVDNSNIKSFGDILNEIDKQLVVTKDVVSVKLYSDLSDEIENYNSILKQTSEIITDNTEVTQEYKDSLIELGISEEDLSDCFDENNPLVVKNAKLLNNLVKSTKNNIAQNAKLAKSQARLQYYELYKEMKKYVNGAKVTDDTTRNYINSLYDQMNALEKTISKYSLLEAKLLGASNAYEKLEEAQAIDEEIDYGSKAENLVNVLGEAINSRNLGTEAAKTAIEGLVPESIFKDLDTADEKMDEIYKYFTEGPISQLFTIEFDDDGAISSVEMTEENLKKYINSSDVFNGTWDNFTLDSSINSMEDFMAATNMTKEVAFAFLTELEKYDISWLDGNYNTIMDQLMSGDLDDAIYNTIQKLSDLEMKMANGTITDEELSKYNEYTDNLNALGETARQNVNEYQKYTEQLDEAKQALEDYNDKLKKDPTNEEYQKGISDTTKKIAELTGAMSEIEPTDVQVQLAIDNIDKDIKEVKDNITKKFGSIDVDKFINWDSANNKYVIATEYQEDPDFIALANYMNEKHTLEVGLGESITTVEESLQSIVDILEKVYDIVVGVDDSEVWSWWKEFSQANFFKKISMVADWAFNGSDDNELNGTAHAHGTAYAGGKWGAKKTETALTGELGPELLVRGDHWTTIGENGAEFTQIKKGDIIFNHKQTEELLKNGYVTGRGKAYANGTSYGGNSLLDRMKRIINSNKLDQFAQYAEEMCEQYEKLTNGNVDLRKRPHLSPSYEHELAMGGGYNSFIGSDGEIYASTSAETITIGEGENQYTIDITPVLENGEVLTSDALAEYVDNLVTDGSMQDLLDSDKYNLVIHAVPGEYDEKDWAGFEDKLSKYKDSYLDTILDMFNLGGEKALEKYGFSTVGLADVSRDLQNNGSYTGKEVASAIDDTSEGMRNLSELINQYVTSILNVDDTEAISNLESEIETTASELVATGENVSDVQAKLDLLNATNISDKTFTVTTVYQTIGSGLEETVHTPGGSGRYTKYANGTVHADRSAYSNGNFGVPRTETALVGELGPEMLVRNGRWTTIGDNGAEFTQVKKGDIIFNHKQTEDLLKNGYITGRGKLKGGAFANGTVQTSGPAYAYTIGTTLEEDKKLQQQLRDSIKKTTDNAVVATEAARKLIHGVATTNVVNRAIVDTWHNSQANLANDYASNKTSGTSNTSDAAEVADTGDEFKEIFDWVAIRLEEINEELDYMNAQLENAATYSSKNTIIDDMIAKNRELQSNLRAGIDEYEKYATKLLAEIPDKYRTAAQDGMIEIIEFAGEADEATVEAINNYREWAQKVADLRQQLEETKTTIRDLAIEKFNNAYDAGSVRATVEDSQTKKLQNAVDLINERGEIAAAAYYGINGGNAENSTGMFENAYKKIQYLTEARIAMQKELDDAVKAGQIIRGSNEWYELIDQMYQVQSEIDEATIELEQFQNAINDLYWDNFDELINRLGYLQNETQNLIDLMDKADMVTKPEGRTYEGGTIKYWTADDVQWTEEGIASLGLYTQQMEIAEYTAKQYAEAIKDLQKDYAAGKYSENEYLEKLNELKDAQYENIEAYYDAQDAIKSLNEARIDSIKDGIQKEIDAYEELISKKKEELDAEKDLYDFQKSVAEQQKSISDIQRKIAAISAAAEQGDMSAIAQKKKLEAELAEAQADLQESYYDRSVSDRSDALDKELEDFENEKNAEIEKLEEYLENVEQVVADSLMLVQDNALGVYNTLSEKAQEYDLTLSDAIMTPWQDGALAVSDYQTTFDTAMSSTMDQLEALKNAWQEVIDKMAEAGNANVANINKENANYAAATYTEPAKPSQPSTPSNPTPAQKAPPSVGQTVRVKSSATHFSTQSGSAKMASFVPGGSYQVMQVGINGDKSQILIGKNGQYTGWVWLKDLEGYASGTKKLDKSGIVNIDELGEELVIGAHNGRLTYLEKGSGVIPADLTSNLMKWGELDPQDMLDRNRPSIMPSKSIINNEISINMNIAEVVHIDEVTNDTIPDLTKAVQKQMDSYMVKLNNAIKAKVR